MQTSNKNNTITINAIVHSPLEKVWECWNTPHHIIKWNAASPDWHTTYAENDLRTGGKLKSRMEAKDGSFGFDFEGIYEEVVPMHKLRYVLEDGRVVTITFEEAAGGTWVTESFDAENENSLELQEMGWMAILHNFKAYAEKNPNPPMTFEIEIPAPVAKVYSSMIDPIHYKTWTAAFNETSHFKGSWDKGSDIHFIGQDQEGNVGGMVSRIKENKMNQFISIEHLGLIQGEEIITEGPMLESWAGALENYYFIDKGESTMLRVQMDTNEEFKGYFETTWPKALEVLKTLCI
ncbi:MAG: SRPBCC domain-containing protein [Saprospiraceae bacterium]|nr:SRPBCC domain-containing protein [Saprospiraceae bacterium]